MRFRVFKFGILSGLICAISISANASEFYFDFNRNTLGSPATALVFLFGGAGTNVNVSTLSGFSQNVTLNSDGFFNLPIANTFQQSGTGTVNT